MAAQCDCGRIMAGKSAKKRCVLAKNNVATDEEVKRMVPAQVVAEAAAKLGHTTESVSQDKVLLTIVAYAPAKRSDLGALGIVLDLSSTHGTEDSIVVPADSTKLTTLVLNRYKTGRYDRRHVELLPRTISDVVRKSIMLWPRKFLFAQNSSPDKGAPLSNDAYRTRILEVIYCHNRLQHRNQPRASCIHHWWQNQCYALSLQMMLNSPAQQRLYISTYNIACCC